MKKTLEKLNELLELEIIEKYAICGGIAHFYYIEPSVTYDMDIVVRFRGLSDELTPLSSIYNWAKKNNYSEDREHIIVEEIPVQFLPEYSPLIVEALNNAVEITIFDTKTYIFSAEYLMAIMLDTNRPKDRVRLLQFMEEAEYDREILENIIDKFKLRERYARIVKEFNE